MPSVAFAPGLAKMDASGFPFVCTFLVSGAFDEEEAAAEDDDGAADLEMDVFAGLGGSAGVGEGSLGFLATGEDA